MKKPICPQCDVEMSDISLEMLFTKPYLKKMLKLCHDVSMKEEEVSDTAVVDGELGMMEEQKNLDDLPIHDE